MKISPSGRLTVGVLTALVCIYPLIFMGFFVLIFFTMALSMLTSISDSVSFLFALPFGLFCLIFPIQFLVIFAIIGLQVFYLIHVIQNTRAAEVTRVLLGVGLFVLPFVAMPVYYYLYLWLPTPPAWAVALSPLAGTPAGTLPPAAHSEDPG